MRFLSIAFLACALIASAQQQSRPVPPIPRPGVEVPERDRADLEAGLKRLGDSLATLQGLSLAPDIQIFHNAVRYALTYNEFFQASEIASAKELLRAGQARVDELAKGRAGWTDATGLVVRGYVSKIDKSVQPYALVVPPNYNRSAPWKWRLDTWFHGRGETLSEVNFLTERMRNPGEFTPPNTIVLHLYGRYCNGSKFAGEIDLFEALAAVKNAYNIDENRIVIRGFSLGGASAWHLATHFAGEWAAAAPGAGFAETPEFLRMSPEAIAQTPWWEQRLWRLYNATEYAENLFNLPVVAYSGEIDGQKQAADVMTRHMTEVGLNLKHIIGPKTGHRYHPESKVIIDSLLDRMVAKGNNRDPKHVRFTTHTLRYNRMKWVVVDGLDKHWEKARIEAEVKDGRDVVVRTANIREFHFETAPGSDLLELAAAPAVTIDGQKLTMKGPFTDGSWSAAFRKVGTKWTLAPEGQEAAGLQKRSGLQGPIDDAFMDSFIIVTPSGTPNGGTAAWIKAEQERAIREWRRQWRGEAQVKVDTEVTEADIANSNLVLWGDAAGNKVIGRLGAAFPVKWEGDQVLLGDRKFPGANHVPVLIYPNPLNPKRYVVLNSGPTQREFDYTNNARQVPRLPDYAIVDTTTPPDARSIGKIVAAGFFDENWKLQSDDGKGKQP